MYWKVIPLHLSIITCLDFSPLNILPPSPFPGKKELRAAIHPSYRPSEKTKAELNKGHRV